MTLETLRLLGNILLRAALLCYVVILISAILWVPFSQTWTELTMSWYHVSAEKVSSILLDYVAVAKFFAVFLLLLPGLAIHWTIKSEQARIKA